MIVITIAFVSCISWLRSGIERYADRKLSLCCQFFVSGFVGLLTDLFMRVKRCSLWDRVLFFAQTHCFSLLSGPWQPFQWPVFTARGDSPHGKQYFRITATFGILPRACNLKCTDCNPAMDSFRVRDSHPIPLFSEQECVSDCSGRAFATKAMLFSLLYARLFYAHKKTSPALLSRRQKKSRILYIFSFGVRKNYLFI